MAVLAAAARSCHGNEYGAASPADAGRTTVPRAAKSNDETTVLGDDDDAI
jgi:hypothetical protein